MSGTSGYRRYVAGFLFRQSSPVTKGVLLVRKNHPKWQANLMNGIGGEIEDGESILGAMVREFKEEANYVTNGWDLFASEHGPGYEVWFFRHTLPESLIDKYVAPEFNDKDEELVWCVASDIKYPVIGNLHWLMPLALDPRPIQVRAETTGDIRKLATW